MAREPLILYDPGSFFFLLINQACREAVEMAGVEMNLDSIEATEHMIELAMGISFLPRSGVAQHLARGGLTVIPLTGGHKVVLTTCGLVRKGQADGPTVKSSLSWLKDLYDARIPGDSRPR